jgi:hypothetical protein
VKTFSQFAWDTDNLADVLSEEVSLAVAGASALAMVFKISQLGRTLQSADSKILSKQLVWLGSIMALAIHAGGDLAKR